jgi:hypothetical protein
MNNFRRIKDATVLDSVLPPKAAPSRVGLVSAGNPDVLREAAGLADYANPRKRKRGGRAKIVGVRARHRLDRPSRRKFGDGGTADAESDQSTQTTASADDAPTSRGFVDALMASPKVRAVGTALTAINKAGHELTGSKPAYKRGGSARR